VTLLRPGGAVAGEVEGGKDLVADAVWDAVAGLLEAAAGQAATIRVPTQHGDPDGDGRSDR
jgi:hypothetical protein